MTDLKNLTPEELMDQLADIIRPITPTCWGGWAEIRRRLERLETLEPLYAASESLRQQVNDDRTKELIIYQKLRERLEQCEAALRTIARGIGMDHLKPKDVPGVMQDAARAALEK